MRLKTRQESSEYLLSTADLGTSLPRTIVVADQEETVVPSSPGTATRAPDLGGSWAHDFRFSSSGSAESIVDDSMSDITGLTSE